MNQTSSSRDLGTDQTEIIEEVDEDGSSEEEEMEAPWTFWKWLIPVYTSIFCVSIMLTISFWFSEATSSQFLIYVHDNDEKVLFDLLPTLPTIYLLLEFPFNMIPFDWPMLIFVEALFSIYMLINFVALSLEEPKNNIYTAFEWYDEPLSAFAALIGCYVILALIFATFWAISKKWKLPKF
mmetsp:Transcript_10971/g.14837  ORF Transcript_10971/g.14837 Transcript_10971/m.14837 type:complete len:181 (+) Transcript_10971:503-1045(+)